MVILILIDFQYFKNILRILFSALKKVQVGQNNSLSVSHDSETPQQIFHTLIQCGGIPLPATLFEKPCLVLLTPLFPRTFQPHQIDKMVNK